MAQLERRRFNVTKEPANRLAGIQRRFAPYRALRRGQFTSPMVKVEEVEQAPTAWTGEDRSLHPYNKTYRVVVRRPGFEERTVGSFSLGLKRGRGAVSISGFSPWQFDPKQPGVTLWLSEAKDKAVSGSGLPDVVIARIEQIAKREGASELRALDTPRSEKFYLRLGFTRKGPYLVKKL